MPAVGLSQEQFNRVFGPKDDLDNNGPGRSRKCKVCGGWHRLDKPWPHNCRSEAPRRNLDLAMPQLAPSFEPFLSTPMHPDAEVIGSRNAKREYMKRNGLVEYDKGVGAKNDWVEQYQEIESIVSDIKNIETMDHDRRRHELGAERMVDGGSLAEGTEIDMDAVT